jgi:hypothetical protein
MIKPDSCDFNYIFVIINIFNGFKKMLFIGFIFKQIFGFIFFNIMNDDFNFFVLKNLFKALDEFAVKFTGF